MTNTLSPRNLFLANKPVAAAHADLAASPVFHQALTTALVEYQMTLLNTDTASIAANGLRLAGAQGFIHVLLNIAAPVAPRVDKTAPGLTPPEIIPSWGPTK